MKKSDTAARAEALSEWFRSQEIPAEDAVDLMLKVSGISIGTIATSEDDLAKGLIAGVQQLILSTLLTHAHKEQDHAG